MSDLHTISEAIGGLRAQVTNLERAEDRARERDEKIFGQLADIRANLATQPAIETRLKTVEAHVEDYKKVRAWGAAIWTGSMALAGAVGYAAQFLQTWVKKA